MSTKVKQFDKFFRRSLMAGSFVENINLLASKLQL